MAVADMHPEDIKAALRKRFGSIFAFEDQHDLPRKSLTDFLRGRSNRHVSDVIQQVLAQAVSDKSDVSADQQGTHRLFSEAR